MSKQLKTITMQEHRRLVDMILFQQVRSDRRQLALDHAVRTQREGDSTASIVARAKAFEAYLADGKPKGPRATTRGAS